MTDTTKGALDPVAMQEKLAFEICEEVCTQLDSGVNETRMLAAKVVTSERVKAAIRALIGQPAPASNAQEAAPPANTAEWFLQMQAALPAGYTIAKIDASPPPVRPVDREKLAETIHNARWPAERTLFITPFSDEDRNGREYCYRIADAILALTSAGADSDGAVGGSGHG